MSNSYLTTTGRLDVGRFPDRVREVAFELWWIECDRDPVKVASRLRDDVLCREQAGLAVDDKTPSDDSIRRWSKDEAWADEAHRRMRQMAPHMLERGAVALVYAAPDAVNTVVRLAKGAMAGERFTVSERVALDAAKEVIAKVYGEAISTLAKPTVDHAVDFDNLDDMDSIIEAERSLGSG